MSRARWLVAGVPLALVTAAVIAPVLSRLDYPVGAFAMVAFFSRVCHQLPERTFLLFGMPVAVCARCLGIYSGAVAGAWVRASRGVLLRWVAVAMLVNVGDVVAEALGMHGNWMVARFALGAMLGAALAAVVGNECRAPSAEWRVRSSPRGAQASQ